MKRHITVLRLVFVIMFAVSSISQAIGEGWTDNFEQAKATAAADGKDLLVDFTGSDWCGWCIKLDTEVFQKDTFKSEAPKEFVLVALDYPRDKSKVSEETTKQNSTLKDEYGIRGYPTIYLMDESGRPYARTGYQAGGPDTYLAHLAKLKSTHQERDGHFAAAKDANNDLAKAKSIDKALEVLGTELASQFYEAEMTQIIAFDPENKAGLKDKYEQQMFDAKVRRMMGEKKYEDAIELIEAQITSKHLKGQGLIDLQLIMVQAYSMKGDSDTAIKTVDSVIAENNLQGEALQEALSTKAQVYQAKRDTENMMKVLGEAIKAAPETPIAKSMQAYLDRMKKTDKR
jgi:thioredoxin-related protein